MMRVSLRHSRMHLLPWGARDLKLSPEATASLTVRSGMGAPAELGWGRGVGTRGRHLQLDCYGWSIP